MKRLEGRRRRKRRGEGVEEDQERREEAQRLAEAAGEGVGGATLSTQSETQRDCGGQKVRGRATDMRK